MGARMLFRAFLGVLLSVVLVGEGHAQRFGPRPGGIRSSGPAIFRITPPDVPGVPGTPDPIPGDLKLYGVNVPEVTWYSAGRPYTNLLAYHRPQVNCFPGSAGCGADPDGNLPRSAVNESTGVVTISIDAVYTTIHPPTNAGARVRLRWAGSGQFDVQLQSANNITSGTDGPYKYLEFDTIGGVPTSLGVARGTYSFWDAREVDRPLSQKWDPDYVANLSQYGLARFMDWSFTNATYPFNFTAANRPKPNMPFRIQEWGQSFEDAIDLAAAANVDAWLCIPLTADQSYVDAAIAYAHAHMPAGRQIFIEYVNEIWNGSFYAYGILKNEWRASNAPLGEPLDTLAQQVIRSNQVMTWVKAKAQAIGASVGPTGRFRRELGVQTGAGSNLDFIIERPGALANHDDIAIAPYFGGNLFNILPETNDVATLMERMTTDEGSGIDSVAANVRLIRAQADAHGMGTVTYEQNSHATTPTRVATSIALHRDPAFRALYSYYLREMLRASPGMRQTLFNQFGAVNQYGPWGVQDDVKDTTSPRYLALQDARLGVFTPPALTILNRPPAATREGYQYIYTPDARWGDGPNANRVWSFTGSLPPGMTFSAQTGEPKGIGTTAGTYNMTLRAQDPTGFATRAITISVLAPETYTYVDDVRQVGTLPVSGAGSSRTSSRGWSQNYGFANAGAVYYDEYQTAGPNLIGQGINSKNRKALVDIDSTTWTDVNDGAEIQIVAADGNANSEIGLRYYARGFIQAYNQHGAYLNLGTFPKLAHTKVTFEVSLIDGTMRVTANGNPIGEFNAGTDYNAVQRMGFIPYIDLYPYVTKPAYSRISLKAL